MPEAMVIPAPLVYIKVKNLVGLLYERPFTHIAMSFMNLQVGVHHQLLLLPFLQSSDGGTLLIHDIFLAHLFLCCCIVC